MKNIAIILASLCGFAVISERLNMIAASCFQWCFSPPSRAPRRTRVRILKISLA